MTDQIIKLSSTNLQRASHIKGIKIHDYCLTTIDGEPKDRQWTILVSYGDRDVDSIQFANQEACEAQYSRISGEWLDATSS